MSLDIDLVLKLHLKWLNGEPGGERANLESANLEFANLEFANLEFANLKSANLESANLEFANLESANLKSANLKSANLKSADLDFSCLPLWCGSFHMKVDDNLVEQILTHVKMLDVSECSKENQELIKNIPNRVKDKLRSRHDLNI